MTFDEAIVLIEPVAHALCGGDKAQAQRLTQLVLLHASRSSTRAGDPRVEERSIQRTY